MKLFLTVLMFFCICSSINARPQDVQPKPDIPSSTQMVIPVAEGISDLEPAQNNTAGKLEKLIPDLMSRADVPGVSIALIEDGKVVWVGSFGVKNVQTGEKVDDRTVFEAASISKPVFTFAVLKLVDEGKLDLDVSLSKYVPSYVANDDRVNLITARMVLTHRTGLPNWRDGTFSPLKIYFQPGDRFSYSGEGFIYLQRVVEKISGQPLKEFVRQSVFVPLGMLDSSYVWQDQYEFQHAVGYLESGPLPPSKPIESGSPLPPYRGPSAASSLHSTARDLAKFVVAVMNGTGLKTETIRQMLSPQSRVDAGCMHCIDKPVTQTAESISWGLGIGLEETPHGRSFFHGGDNRGFHSFLFASPDSKRGVVVLTNSDRGPMILPEIVNLALGESQPYFNWHPVAENYEHYDSPRMQLDRAILEKGIDEAMKEYAAGPPLDEGPMDSLGRQLLGQKKFKEAIRIFDLNTAAHPKSSDAFRSLAEGYGIAGKQLSIEYARKSLELNPNDHRVIEMLERLEAH